MLLGSKYTFKSVSLITSESATKFSYHFLDLHLMLIIATLFSLASAAVVPTARWTVPVPKNSSIVLPSSAHHSPSFLPFPSSRTLGPPSALPSPKLPLPSPANHRPNVITIVHGRHPPPSPFHPPPLMHPLMPPPILPASLEYLPNFPGPTTVRFSLAASLNRVKNSLAKLFRFGPKPERRVLNLRRFQEQYQRGKQNAMLLYRAIVEAQERRLLEDPSLAFQEKDSPDGPVNMMNSIDLMQDRKVKSVVHRIISNFIGDCVAVVIGEVFRKSGELVGEAARFVVSHAANVVLTRSGELVGKSAGKLASIAKRSNKLRA